MSTSSTTPASPTGVAPWRPLFQSHIAKLSSPEFVLSTLHATSDPNSPTPYLPRARYCIYRGLWAELPENSHNTAPKNARVYESDLLTFTTDVRMEKIHDFFSSSTGHGDISQSQGSGGGGPVEAVFWVKDVMTQWRIKGTAYVIGPDIESSEGEESSGVRTAKTEIGKRMRVIDESGKGEWSWGKEVTGHFGNLSPKMRGSFKNPSPGKSMSLKPTEEGVGRGQSVEDLDDVASRRNFRVVVIRPDEVEQLDLTDPNEAKRWKFTYVGAEGEKEAGEGEVIGEWRKEDLWP